MITKMGQMSRMSKKFADDIGIVMNQSKEEHQVGFVGRGSVTSSPTQRVLGTLLTYSCSNVVERQARLRAAQAGWTVMGRFGIIFRSMVWLTLLTWWETLLPSRADCSLMRRNAGGRWIDAEGKISCAYNGRSFDMAETISHPPGAPDSPLTLVAKHSHGLGRQNEALLGIFFGRLGAEVEGPLLDNGLFLRRLILGRCS